MYSANDTQAQRFHQGDRVRRAKHLPRAFAGTVLASTMIEGAELVRVEWDRDRPTTVAALHLVREP